MTWWIGLGSLGLSALILGIILFRDDLQKKKVNLGTLALKGGRGQKKIIFFSLIRKRENYLRGGGVKSKSPFLIGNFIGKF